MYFDNKTTNKGNSGLIFHGSNETNNWIDSAGYTTPVNAWIGNYSNVASVSAKVDATYAYSLILKFKLKQIYKDKPDHSWFRLLVNGKEIKDIKGKYYFNPSSKNDNFAFRTYDLSKYIGSVFTLTFETCCKTEDDYVLLDNISISNSNNFFVFDNDDDFKN